MDNPPFMDNLPIETSIYMGFPIAMFNYRRVFQTTKQFWTCFQLEDQTVLITWVTTYKTPTLPGVKVISQVFLRSFPHPPVN